jgi:UDP-N-acetyl-D-glucosamine dehydrogenase
MGYVGLPLALRFASTEGFNVLGFDTDEVKVAELNQGKSYISHIDGGRVQETVKAGTLRATTDFKLLSTCDAIIICVPTPLGGHREPDLTYVLKSGVSIGQNLKKGQLVVLESTTYPGTTDEDLRAVLEAESGLKAGEDFHLAYSPEREDPGNAASSIENIPKVVGGYTPACGKRAEELYIRIVPRVVPVSNARVAEACKLLENIFRCVNIALVNELKLIYQAMGIDVWEVIRASSTKPFGFMPFYPGPGLGGHCIPIDPFYLTWKAREYGLNTRFIELAGEINTQMPVHVIAALQEALNERGRTFKGSRILVVGLAYKPNVDDTRESPSFVLMDLLKARGAEVAYHDPHVPVIPPTREHAHWAGVPSITWDRDTLSGFDAVLISTAHRSVNYEELGEWSQLIVDTRNAMGALPQYADRVIKA